MMFQCDQCGACCRHLGWSDLYRELDRELDRGDGVCKYLSGNLCSIYKDRPLLCRVDESYEILFKGIMSRETYDKLNYEACEKLKQG